MSIKRRVVSIGGMAILAMVGIANFFGIYPHTVRDTVDRMRSSNALIAEQEVSVRDKAVAINQFEQSIRRTENKMAAARQRHQFLSTKLDELKRQESAIADMLRNNRSEKVRINGVEVSRSEVQSEHRAILGEISSKEIEIASVGEEVVDLENLVNEMRHELTEQRSMLASQQAKIRGWKFDQNRREMYTDAENIEDQILAASTDRFGQVGDELDSRTEVTETRRAVQSYVRQLTRNGDLTRNNDLAQ